MNFKLRNALYVSIAGMGFLTLGALSPVQQTNASTQEPITKVAPTGKEINADYGKSAAVVDVDSVSDDNDAGAGISSEQAAPVLTANEVADEKSDASLNKIEPDEVGTNIAASTRTTADESKPAAATASVVERQNSNTGAVAEKSAVDSDGGITANADTSVANSKVNADTLGPASTTSPGGDNKDVAADESSTSTPASSLEQKTASTSDGRVAPSDIGPGYYDADTSVDDTMTQYKSETEAQKEFLAKVKPLAIEGWSKYGVLPSITGAQAIGESSWGTSRLTKDANNLFGIKGNYQGQSITMETQEVINGVTEWVSAQFRKYPTWEASVNDHGAFLKDNSRYASLIGDKSYTSVADKLQKAGYATSPTYASLLKSLVQEYGLTEWDQEAFNESDYNVIQINYTPGYGVLALDSTGAQIGGTNKKFMDGTKWKAFDIDQVGGTVAYRVSNTEYVPISYTNFKSAITINYEPGYGIDAHDDAGNQIAGSNAKFLTGTSWKWFATRVLNGQVEFRVSNTEWIPSDYTIGGGYIPKADQA